MKVSIDHWGSPHFRRNVINETVVMAEVYGGQWFAFLSNTPTATVTNLSR